MFRRRIPLLLCLVLLVPACDDQGSLTDPPGISPPDPAFAIWDGRVADGNPNFFWLPPVAANTAATGEEHLGLVQVVVVRVCEGEDACDAEDAVAEFTDSEGTGDATIQVIDKHYQVDWNTSETKDGESLAGRTVRVWALLGKSDVVAEQLPVGYVEIFVGSNGREVQTNTGESFGLVDGRTLPLRFRLQTGVTGIDCEVDCAEFVATDDGFDECTENNWACLTATADWLPDGFQGQDILITIERKSTQPGEDCFDTAPARSRQGCYTVTTFPSLGSAPFQPDAVVLFGACQASDLPSDHAIHQTPADFPQVPVRRPVQVAGNPLGLDCEDFQVAMNPFARLGRSLAQLVFGSPLWARHGFACQIGSFSEFYYAPSVDLESVEEPESPQAPGETVTVTVRVFSDHDPFGEGILGNAVEGVTVDFEVDGGVVVPSTGVSDENGEVSVQWTLPAEEGEAVLTARIPIFVEAVDPETSQPAGFPTVTVTVDVEEPDDLIVLLSPGVSTGFVNETVELQVGLQGGDVGDPQGWECFSSNPTVAVVDVTDAGCAVTGVAEGNVTVTAEAAWGNLTGGGDAEVEVLGPLVLTLPPDAFDFTVPGPSTPVDLCNVEFDGCLTEVPVRADVTGETGVFANPFTRVIFYYVDPGSGLLRWWRQTSSSFVVDPGEERAWRWVAIFDAIGLSPAADLPIFAVGVDGNLIPYRSQGENTDISFLSVLF